MSRWNNKADRIRAFLEEQPEMLKLPVIVHRQDDLLNLVNEKVSKSAGFGCVIVKWLGGQNPDRKSGQLRMGARFSISLWTRQVLGDAEAIGADDLIELMAERLHGWLDTSVSLAHRLEVVSVELVPDAPGYIVHEIIAEISRT